MTKTGERVGAVLGANGDTAEFLGFGVYQGDEVPDASARGFAQLAHEAGIPNPKILLDNGDVVWGGECWWGPEAAIAETLRRYTTVNTVRISDARR